MRDKPGLPPLTGTILMNAARRSPQDCWAYGFCRIQGQSYRLKVYEAGYARGERSKKQWRLSFEPVDEKEGNS